MWAHRRLRGKCPRYLDGRDHPEFRSLYPDIPGLVGVYNNPDGTEPEHILIVDDGLHLLARAETDIVLYADLEAVDVPHDKNEPGPGALSLVYHDGRRSTLIIGGRDGRYRDVYQFGHFLMRVVDAGTEVSGTGHGR
jgi:hypothetical protein